MLLKYGDFKHLFPKTKGIQDEKLEFFTVATDAKFSQPKGLFIPLGLNAGELNKAITNGAIATIWNIHTDVPHYKPNHFPIFFTNDINKSLIDLMELYLIKLKNIESGNMTNFLFSRKGLLNEKKDTYSVSDMKENLQQIITYMKLEQRG
ncbi:hypothetical protein K6959_05435 [Bacillus aquiflavi]|uniref:hypothetical protein n=1 Tax=Bacillus aquiflavi TaxID=2672567 RepID=UPI001CAA376F|nr:hypothetical protein [Bacillus aquiflavi]UAC49304.1 hypothetical protein K6959_05435 [Bacillus aquiflavi]